jgi:hypothetical protein
VVDEGDQEVPVARNAVLSHEEREGPPAAMAVPQQRELRGDQQLRPIELYVLRMVWVEVHAEQRLQYSDDVPRRGRCAHSRPASTVSYCDSLRTMHLDLSGPDDHFEISGIFSQNICSGAR